MTEPTPEQVEAPAQHVRDIQTEFAVVVTALMAGKIDGQSAIRALCALTDGHLSPDQVAAKQREAVEKERRSVLREVERALRSLVVTEDSMATDEDELRYFGQHELAEGLREWLAATYPGGGEVSEPEEDGIESQQDVIQRLAPTCTCPDDLCIGEDSGCTACGEIDPEWDCLRVLGAVTPGE